MYTSLAANDFLVTLVTNNHFEPGAYSNTTEVNSWFRDYSRNATTGKEYGDIGYQTDSDEIQLFTSMLEGHNASTPSYEDLTISQCTSLYKTDFMSNHRNLFLVSNHTSDDTYNNTILDMTIVMGDEIFSNDWLCFWNQEISDRNSQHTTSRCSPSELASNVAGGLPWQMNLTTVGVIDITGCKSEITDEKCKVQFSLGIMIAVICCNLVKACSMIMTIVRSREPTLVTLGDAVDSFLRTPDPTTVGICFADRRYIEREWRRGRRTGPRQWKQKGVQRWWTSVSKTRWITCNFCFAVIMIAAAVLLRLGIRNDGMVWNTDLKSM